METSAGHWVAVTLPEGAVRQDWVPAEQPPSPNRAPGAWHVVTEADGAHGWEWHEKAPPPMPPSLPGATPTRKRPPDRPSIMRLLFTRDAWDEIEDVWQYMRMALLCALIVGAVLLVIANTFIGDVLGEVLGSIVDGLVIAGHWIDDHVIVINTGDND